MTTAPTTAITTDDIARIAAMGRTTGELIEAWGTLMLTLTADWETGAKAANLDPNRSTRHENCGPGAPPQPGCPDCPHDVPADPTGEAAIATARGRTAAELRERLARYHDDAAWLRDMAHVLAPIVPPSIIATAKTDDRWCIHHLAIGLCEPRYQTSKDCRWCYDFRALWQANPPNSLLRQLDDHRKGTGKRITEARIKSALEAEGHILADVDGITQSIGKARGRTGKPNQNQKRKAG